MSWRWLAVVAIAVAGCAAQESLPSPSPGVDDLFFPRHGSPLGVGDAALLEGDVVFADACLWVEAADGTRYLILWPSDTSLGMINSLPAILGPGRELLVETGSRTSLGGSQTDRATAERLVGEVPERCAGEAFWVVSTVERRP